MGSWTPCSLLGISASPPAFPEIPLGLLPPLPACGHASCPLQGSGRMMWLSLCTAGRSWPPTSPQGPQPSPCLARPACSSAWEPCRSGLWGESPHPGSLPPTLVPGFGWFSVYLLESHWLQGPGLLCPWPLSSPLHPPLSLSWAQVGVPCGAGEVRGLCVVLMAPSSSSLAPGCV